MWCAEELVDPKFMPEGWAVRYVIISLLKRKKPRGATGTSAIYLHARRKKKNQDLFIFGTEKTHRHTHTHTHTHTQLYQPPPGGSLRRPELNEEQFQETTTHTTHKTNSPPHGMAWHGMAPSALSSCAVHSFISPSDLT